MFAAEKVKALRLSKGLSARTFGAKVGVIDRSIRRYEAGEMEPPLSTAGRMARVLGVPLDDLYVHEQDRSHSGDPAPENTRAPIASRAGTR